MTSQTATFENHWLFTASPNQGRTTLRRPQSDSRHLRPILVHARLPSQRGRPGHLPRYARISAADATGLRPMPTRNVSADFARDALGLIALTTRKVALKRSTS